MRKTSRRKTKRQFHANLFKYFSVIVELVQYFEGLGKIAEFNGIPKFNISDIAQGVVCEYKLILQSIHGRIKTREMEIGTQIHNET